jgi:predicted nucleotidyltransferase
MKEFQPWRRSGGLILAMLNLPKDFQDFLRLLNGKGARYLLIGGYAVGLHGYVRATGDLDIWIESSLENGKIILSVLKEFGFPVDSIPLEIFEKEDQIIRMGVPPIRIEVITSIDGVEFHECYSKHEEMVISGVSIPVISLDDLKKNKKASGRHKDLDDLENLEK